MVSRTKAAPAWAAALLVIGGALFPLSRIPDISGLALVGDVLLVVALGAIGLGMVRNICDVRTARGTRVSALST